jgi:glycosyltransferase involved in cell wall biosynthesis
MRVGQNPAKSIQFVRQPERITVAVVSYIPFLRGYYSQSLDVLKLCLRSVQENTRVPFDLFVFDNASCPEVREYLLEENRLGRIQYLTLSDNNIGKGGAWNFIFQASPGDIIAYADGDVHFQADWLVESLKILETYPRTGMVTARPLRSPEEFYTSTLEWAKNTPGVHIEETRYIPWEVFYEHHRSLGTSEDQAREWFESKNDRRLIFSGTEALIGAAHFQFTAYKSVLQEFLPFLMDRPMGQVRSLDEKLNSAGYLRLSTAKALVKHLGNRIEDRKSDPYEIEAQKFIWRISDNPLLKRFLLAIYNGIFELYYR